MLENKIAHHKMTQRRTVPDKYTAPDALPKEGILPYKAPVTLHMMAHSMQTDVFTATYRETIYNDIISILNGWHNV